MMIFRVWHAGGAPDSDGVSVEAESIQAAALAGGRALFEPHDPLDRFDVFVRRGDLSDFGAERFTILVDPMRARFDEAAGSVDVERYEFTASRTAVAVPAAIA